MSKESTLYAFIPSKTELIDNVIISFNNTDCKLVEDQLPPALSSSSLAVRIVWSNRADCHVYGCVVKEALQKNYKVNLQIRYDFVKKNAKKIEKISKFEIVTSICTMSHKEGGNDQCVNENKEILKTTTSFEYIKKTPLELLIGSWQFVAGIVLGLIVFILIFIIFWKCELFKKVRFYDEQNKKLIENRKSRVMENLDEEDKNEVEVDK